MDDILLIWSDTGVLTVMKSHLKQHYVTKDMKNPMHFLGNEVAHQKQWLLLSQRKYGMNLLQVIGLLWCKPISTPIQAYDMGFLSENKKVYDSTIQKNDWKTYLPHWC